MVNRSVDGYIKPQNNGKHSEKRKKTTKYQKPVNMILNWNISEVGLYIWGKSDRLLPARQLIHCNKHFEILIKQK